MKNGFLKVCAATSDVQVANPKYNTEKTLLMRVETHGKILGKRDSIIENEKTGYYNWKMEFIN